VLLPSNRVYRTPPSLTVVIAAAGHTRRVDAPQSGFRRDFKSARCGGERVCWESCIAKVHAAWTGQREHSDKSEVRKRRTPMRSDPVLPLQALTISRTLLQRMAP